MKHRLLLLATAFCLMLPQALAQSKVPSLINYQGNVRNAAGVAIGAGAAVNRTVTFRFYKNPTSVLAADRLWSESQTVTILDGNFNVLIGQGTPVSGQPNAVTPFANVFSQSSAVYLGVTVDDGNSATVDAEISPRQQLVSGAFAFRATVAEGVDNLAITSGMLATNSVTTNQIGSAAVTSEKIANNAVTGAQILNGTIQEAKLATGAVTSAKILDGTIVGADIAANTITAGNIAANTITAGNIAADTITAGNIAADTITAGNIAAGAVASSEILDGSIVAADIADGVITTAKIASGVNITAGNVTVAGKAVPNAEESLRIVRGTISSATNNPTNGVGWTFVNTSSKLTITFTTPFSAPPSVYVSNHSYAGWTQYITGSATTSGFSTSCSLSGTSVSGNTLLPSHGNGVNFIAIGPR